MLRRVLNDDFLSLRARVAPRSGQQLLVGTAEPGSPSEQALGRVVPVTSLA